jgi:hypothetical protein
LTFANDKETVLYALAFAPPPWRKRCVVGEGRRRRTPLKQTRNKSRAIRNPRDTRAH